jgi:hypothetical protein
MRKPGKTTGLLGSSAEPIRGKEAKKKCVSSIQEYFTARILWWSMVRENAVCGIACGSFGKSLLKRIA